jgi:hypothetical protein
VNNRPASALRPGEFTESSGFAYKPNSDQLHRDLIWADFTPTSFFDDVDDVIGPFYLSFENTHDWLLIVCTTASIDGAVAYVARADGSTAWSSLAILADNVVNQTTLTGADIAHWGDRYYLATDQGCLEIAAPTGTGQPTATKLGMLAPEPRLDFIGESSDVVTDTGAWTTGIDATNCDIAEDDVFFVLLTEYDSETGQESAPVLMTGSSGGGWYTPEGIFPYAQASDPGEYPVITFPTDFYGDGDTWRAYFVYLGNANTTVSYNEINNITRAVWQEGAPPVGASILNKDGQTEFAAGTTVSFNNLLKSQVSNPLPVLAIDNARLIYNAFRHPSTSKVCAIWNDSLVLGDSGFRRSDSSDFDEYSNIVGDIVASGNFGVRGSDPLPTVMRYSPPGEPWNQPVPYFMNFASERQDDIRAYQVVNDRLLVLCDRAVHTVRYLPFNNLLASQQGRVKDTVTTNVGLVNQRAVAKVETPRGEMCVWLSRRGLEWSDGTGWDDACPDFSVPDFVTQRDLDEAVLVAVPNEYRLDLYLNVGLYSFYYHPSHIKNGHLKMLGPTVVGKRIYGACEHNGVVYRFDGSNMEWTNTDRTDISASAYTGFVYGDNPFKDLTIEDLAVTHTSVDGTISMQCNGSTTGRAETNGNLVKIDNPELEETGSAGISYRGNYVRFRLSVDAVGDWSVGPIWIQGDEESGGRG